MTHSGDAAEQIVRMSLDGVEYAVKIAGAGAKNIASLLLAALKTQKTQPTQLKVTGHERLKRMLKSGQPLDVFPVREKDIKAFVQEAKKYGIVYCAIRDKNPKEDGMIDLLVRKEDSPKINRVMDRLQYGDIDKATIKSEIVRSKAEKDAGREAPDRADKMDIDSFLSDIMPDEGKSKEGQNQAVQPPVQQKAAPEKQQDFFSTARTKQNPSERGSESITASGKKTTIEPPSVKEEIDQIRADLKKDPKQQTTRHRQPQHSRKPKSKKDKER
jgi:hypothetical protein